MTTEATREYNLMVIDNLIGVIAYADTSELQRSTLNYKNAKAFLAQTNSIHALKRFRGAALRRCAACRRELLNRIVEAETQ